PQRGAIYQHRVKPDVSYHLVLRPVRPQSCVRLQYCAPAGLRFKPNNTTGLQPVLIDSGPSGLAISPTSEVFSTSEVSR
ncbi:MAG TPA: hypothetical protein VK154_04880, partial [Chitinophagales bacterium]|nr:hypothetical protein [Chitinophagales bacterium]